MSERRCTSWRVWPSSSPRCSRRCSAGSRSRRPSCCWPRAWRWGCSRSATTSFLDPVTNRVLVEQVTQFAVLLALMGVGLALDRPLRLRHPGDWRRWSATWRLLLAAMPLTIAGVWLLGWWGFGLAPATALLLGAALAPTDPVLAGDVQVGGPDVETQEAGRERRAPRGPLRADLRGRAQRQPGVPVRLRRRSSSSRRGAASSWLGAVAGLGGRGQGGRSASSSARSWGGCSAKLAFRRDASSLRLAEQGQPLLALPRWRRRSAPPSSSAATASSPCSAAGWPSATPSGATSTTGRCTVWSSGSSGCSPCSCCSAWVSR